MPTEGPNGVSEADSLERAPAIGAPSVLSKLTCVPAGKAPGGTKTAIEVSAWNARGIARLSPEDVTVPEEIGGRAVRVEPSVRYVAPPSQPTAPTRAKYG